MFELVTLPVLQLFAAAINFAVIIVQSRPMFILPFDSLEDVLEVTPLSFHARSHHEKHEKKQQKREKRGMHTPMDPMPRIAS